MLRSLNLLAIVIIVPLVIGAFIGGGVWYYGTGGYDPPTTPELNLEQITLPSYIVGGLPQVLDQRQGVLVLDIAHDNLFLEEELSSLLSRVADLGYAIDLLGEKDSVGRFSSLSVEGRTLLLEDKLRGADSFAVLLPRNPYSEEEIDIVKTFVQKGGKLLLIGDPTRRNEINSLSESFGILFENDYLYNVVEHDINYQNIFIKDFLPDELTEGLRSIALYTAGSIKSSGVPLAFGDANTFSSRIEPLQPFSPIVKSFDGQVLAISDLTFIAAPQNAVVDNERFIANIADYLTRSDRIFHLTDFPHFLDTSIHIVMGSQEMLESASALKGLLEGPQRAVELQNLENPSQDMVFLGSFEDLEPIQHYLLSEDIRIADTIQTPFTADQSRGGSSLIALHRTLGRHVLVILGDSADAVREAVGLLESGNFRRGLVSDSLAIFTLSVPEQQ